MEKNKIITKEGFIRKMEKNKIYRQNAGITLIALVVTIIVLLILAGITINLALGQNGIIGRAQSTYDIQTVETIKQEIELAWGAVQVDGITKGWDNSTKAGALNTELLKEDGNASASWNTTNNVIDVTYKGYETTINPDTGTMIVLSKIETGSEGNEQGENSGESTTPTLPTGAGTTPYLPSSSYKKLPGTDLSTGLVITDAADPTDTTNPGNEYVWVEVPNANLGGNPTYGPNYATQGLTVSKITDEEIDINKEKIESALWAYTGTLISRVATDSKKTTYYGNKDEWYDGSGKNASESTNTNDTTGCGLTLTDYNILYKNMLKSVYNNGGFWIGRYEAGIEGSNTSEGPSLARQSHSNITTSSPYAVCKSDCIPYTWVYCCEAQFLAERANANLLFGIQWDLTLKYLQETGEVDSVALISDSSSWGNVTSVSYNLGQSTAHGFKANRGDPLTSLLWSEIQSGYSHPSSGMWALSTGATETRNVRRNIHDLAGNMMEFTLEHFTSKSSSPCTLRGGDFADNGGQHPASNRNSTSTSGSYYYYRIPFFNLLGCSKKINLCKSKHIKVY